MKNIRNLFLFCAIALITLPQCFGMEQARPGRLIIYNNTPDAIIEVDDTVVQPNSSADFRTFQRESFLKCKMQPEMRVTVSCSGGAHVAVSLVKLVSPANPQHYGYRLAYVNLITAQTGLNTITSLDTPDDMVNDLVAVYPGRNFIMKKWTIYNQTPDSRIDCEGISIYSNTTHDFKTPEALVLVNMPGKRASMIMPANSCYASSFAKMRDPKNHRLNVWKMAVVNLCTASARESFWSKDDGQIPDEVLDRLVPCFITDNSEGSDQSGDQ